MSETQNIKKRAFSSMLWKFAERICAQFVSLVVSIVLARLLMPDDYSVVGIVTIFFTFCNVFITGGLNTALIQKKNSDRLDYSTVLTVSLLMAALMYALVYACAPLVADIYKKEILLPIFRVMGLTFFINAYKSVLCAYVSSSLQFRTFFYATIIGTIISAFIGITMALNGFGPWALVAQQMSNSFIDTLMLAIITRLKLSFKVSFERLKGLFRYGWKVFVTAIISTLYDEIKPLIIGVKFSGADLAYYNKGNSFPAILNATISDTLSAVLFPVMSKMQDDLQVVLAATRKFIRMTSYVVMPIMIGFMAISDNFIRVLLTEKWMPASIYIKILCITYALRVIQTGNLQTIRAIGRSDVLLILEIIKKSAYTVVILLFVLFTDRPEAIALSSAVCSLIATAVNTYPNRKLIGYAYRLQAADILPNLLRSILMAVPVYLMNRIAMPALPLLILQIVTGAIIYIVLSLITKSENFYALLSILKSFRKGH